MQNATRRNFLTLPLPTPIAVAVGQVNFIATHRFRINAAQLCLSDSGVGAGNTTVQVKKNGVALLGAGLSVAAGGAAKTASTNSTTGATGYPEGVEFSIGDTLTVDVTAVPGTTVPKAGNVILDLVTVSV